MGGRKALSNTNIVDFASKDYWVLDIDDCLYTMDCGLHHFIKGNIARIFNAVAAHDPQKTAIIQKLGAILEHKDIRLPDTKNISAQDIDRAFLPIVQSLAQVHPGKVMTYINLLYGNAYDLITPSRDLVQAFTIARDKGIGIHIYTNGPSGPDPEADSHLQKVLRRHHFDQSMIEYLRPRTYSLLMAANAGRAKPELAAMQDFLSFSGIDPSTALMADDSVKNLKTAAQFGLSPLWTHTSIKAAAPGDIAIAKKIQAVRVRDTGAALLQIATAHRNF